MTEFDRRQAIKLLAAAGATGLTAACGPDEAPHAEPVDEPVRIGMVVPRSGPRQAIGTDLLNGFRLFLDANQGRLGRRPVTLLPADERDSPESGLQAVESLLAQRVTALVGVANSAVLLAVRDRIEDARVPLLAAGGVPQSLQSVGAIWCTSYVDDEPGQALGPVVAREVPAGRVAIVAPTSQAGQDAVNGFRQAFGPTDPRVSGAVIWTSPDPDPGSGFFSAALQRVRAMPAAAVFCHYAGPAAVRFLRELRANGLRPRVYGAGPLTEGAVIAELGAATEGVKTAVYYSADLDNATNQGFAAAYRRVHGVAPSDAAVASYDAAAVLDRAIRMAGDRLRGDPLTPAEVNHAIARVGQIDSPRGRWQFNQPQTPQQRWYLREVRRDGRVLSNVTVNELPPLG